MSALDGLRVLDLTRLLPGGFCSLLLADFGADVIKVEDTGMGDYLRWADPGHGRRRPQRGAGVPCPQPRQALGPDRPEGRRRPRRPAAARARRRRLLESFRPGVMDRLGVGYERLQEENPRLVYCAITGYGQDGRSPRRAGHDTNYLARIGLLDLTGDRTARRCRPAARSPTSAAGR